MKDYTEKTDRFIAQTILLVAPFVGRASMLLFVIFLFHGSFRFFLFGWSEIHVLAWDGALSLVFFVQHSGMIRSSFRHFLATIIPAHYTYAVFNLISSIVLLAVFVFWQPSGTVIYELHGFSRWLARGIFVLTMGGIIWCVSALKFFDPFGSIPIRAYLSGRQLRPPKFVINGPYLWVRHPLYFFVLGLIWSCPVLTSDRLLFNVLWTIWIYVGTVLEEKDLVSDFGLVYRQYQQKVPILIPWKGPIDRHEFNHNPE
ncbi:methyltransferase family protein [candidate division CSSED10-310 bacterium]|uniref:Methyltransferase family protein n=1 Tax=candidate division CSSED10-310 bacterium TaxID=2855610 RepID=A0ABV6YUH1_UNCC1